LLREVRTIFDGARREYDEAVQTEKKLLALLNETKTDAFGLNQFEKSTRAEAHVRQQPAVVRDGVAAAQGDGASRDDDVERESPGSGGAPAGASSRSRCGTWRSLWSSD
jgi:hypothetical protein